MLQSYIIDCNSFYISNLKTASLVHSSGDYVGYAILIVNSYRENKLAKYPVINGAENDAKELKSKLEEIGFFVESLVCAKISDYRSHIYQLSNVCQSFPCILFLFSGYENGSDIVFDDGKGIEYYQIFNDLIDPLAAWSKIPKVFIINSYKPRSDFKSLFNIKSQALPLLKNPLCLSLHVSHAQGAAEKRSPLVQDTFVTKFIQELNISDERMYNTDFGRILKHVKRSIETVTAKSKSGEVSIIVKFDDQLMDPLHFRSVVSKENVIYPLSDNKASFKTDPVHPSNSITEGLENAKWFYGSISRVQSESLLIYDGDFLLRQSDSTVNFGRFVLSVLYSNMLYQIPLYISESGIHIKNEPIFKKVTALVEYYFIESHPIPTHDTFVRLLQPPRLRTSQTSYNYSEDIVSTSPRDGSENWFHGRVGRDHVQHCLTNEGDFLVWEAESCFILSYVHERKIHNIYANLSPEGEVTTDLISGNFESLNDLIQHLILHHSYYRGVYLKNAVPPPTSPLRYDNSSVIRPFLATPDVSSIINSPTFADSPTNLMYPGSMQDVDNTLINTTLPLVQQKWFSKRLTSSDVVKILKRSGDFLVRTSQTRPGHLSLSVRAGEKIQTFGIFGSGNGKYTLNPNSSPDFGNIMQLVNYYVTTGLPLPASLGPQSFLIRPIDVSKFN